MKDVEIELFPREIALLRCLRDGGLPRKEVAITLGMPQSELTRLVRSLESKGIVEVRWNGASSSLFFSEMKHASMLRRILNEYGHMRLEEVLSLASLRVVASLAMQPASTRKEILSSSGVSARTLQTVLSRFRGVGILSAHKRGVYELSDRFLPFADFVRELMSFSNQRKASAFSSDSVVIWERGKEFIVRTKAREEGDSFRRTAFSAFDGYGVPLVQDWHYYYHPRGGWRRTPDEVLLQSLLIRPLGSREMSAVKMLWDRKTLGRNINQLRAKARRYGVNAELEGLIKDFKG
jgi:DNA-binding MarR family transcriptional regulator